MTNEERVSLVAPCGIDCGICEGYLCRNDEELKEYLISRGFPADRLPCDGCRAVKGNCPAKSDTCTTWKCVTDNAVTFCHECGEFPCNKLAAAADKANILPHNMKVYNLCVVKKRGVNAFVSESPGIKARYYKGIMKIGEGPIIPETGTATSS